MLISDSCVIFIQISDHKYLLGLPGYSLGGPRCSSVIQGLSASSVFVASSVRVGGEDDVRYAFLNTPHIPGIQRGGWCPDITDTNPYMEVYFIDSRLN